MFTSQEFEDFAASTGFKLLNSSPYYAQANGQAEAPNQFFNQIDQEEDQRKSKEVAYNS
jgi:hypothetical protein